MADDARQPRPDLTSMTTAPPEMFDMFELLRVLERDGRQFGQGGRPDREPARLGQRPRLGFALRDVMAFEPADGKTPARVSLASLGLFGPEGPMPLHLTRWVLDRLSQRWFGASGDRETSDSTFLDFANALQHRMLALYYRAWADAHPAVQFEREGGGRHRAMLAAMAGIGMPGAESPSEGLDLVRLRHAAMLAHQIDGPERLTSVLCDALAVPVRLVEFVGAWMPVPAALQTRIGGANARLGKTASIGPRSFQRQGRIELVLGPLTLAQFKTFLPGGRQLPVLKSALGDLAGAGLDVDVRPVLRKSEVPAARLGASQLGHTTWLPTARRGSDAGDLLMRTLVGYRPESSRAAA